KIDARLEAVANLFDRDDLSESMAEVFTTIPDLERLAGRLGLGKANPRTLLAVRDSIILADKIKDLLTDTTAGMLQTISSGLPDLSQTADKIGRAVKEDVPLSVSGGGIFNVGYSEELDHLNDSIKDARAYIAELAASERERTGIPSLKVGFNKIFGYYIEVTRIHSDKVPEGYIRKQTLVNAERYITEEMKEKESLILEAEEKINRLEEDLFHRLTEDIAIALPQLTVLADSMAEIDLINSLARLARQEKYARPTITETRTINISQGCHPVISQIMGPGNFVANDVTVSDEDTSIILLTGPNMSGKSTWLRQTGLIVILAQIGSFVPAEAAEIGIVDRVFTRVGANDNLTRGQSTFLVEMVETANILHNKTDRSLLLLDEIGRGTSTFDGLSVAWAVAESIYNHTQGTPRTLFATHYHEMTGLAGIYPRIKNFQVTVKKWGQEIIFLHQVLPGGCDDSYGIEVARLAGLPKATIKRAHEVLKLLDSGKFAKSELARGVHVRLNQTSLFDQSTDVQVSEIEKAIAELDVDNLTPLKALEILTALKKDVDEC
ncbi:MAG: DNA mismatch repair protein MutS, partial [FCB group bacterium]|nr:DNA mismatch repair protein MutS [FCB group bacterium]